MKRLILIFCFVVPLAARAETVPGTNPPPNTNGAYFPLYQKTAPNITDLALIYQGGDHRPKWTTNYFAPYVTYTNPQTGREQWLFDGFLFIEFQDGRGHSFEPFPKNEPAQEIHWLNLIERNFSADGLPALEQTCRDAALRLGPPLRRRQVVLTLPVPIRGQTNWGEINGRALNFKQSADQIAACEWYMDTALAKWRALAPKELDLVGFYWLQEDALGSNSILPALAKQVHRRGRQFFWIPYWQPKSAVAIGNWRSYGFDAVWQQPNYFFNPKTPDTRLQEACDFARRSGMGLELEFDGRVLSQPTIFEPRLAAYLNAFARYNVEATSSIAWYEGGGALNNLATSKEPGMRQHYDHIAQFILSRQRRADEQCKGAH
jgi:hypothetical protein